MKRSSSSGPGSVWHELPDMRRKLQRPSCPPAALPPAQNSWAGPPTSLQEVQKAHASFEAALAAAYAAAECTCSLGEQDTGTQDLQPQGLVARMVANLQTATATAAGTSSNAAAGAGADVGATQRAAMASAVTAALVHPMKQAAAQHLSSWQEGAGAGRSSSASRWAPAPLAAASVLPTGEGDAVDRTVAGAESQGVAGPCVAAGELLLTVVVCRPRREHTSAMLELQVLGSSLLSELRDAISCWVDHLAASAGCAQPSAYFAINGTFYNDLRQPGAQPVGAAVQRALLAQAGKAGSRRLQPLATPPAAEPSGASAGAVAMAADGVGDEQQATATYVGAGSREAAASSGLVAQLQPQQRPSQQQQQLEVTAASTAATAQAASAAVAAQAGRSAGEADQVLTMEATRMQDLQWSISNRATYVYCHQGVCEHGWYVSDIRRVSPGDPQLVAQYPRVTYRAKPPAKAWACGVCGKGAASKVILHHPEAPSHLVLACTTCTHLLVPPDQPLPPHLQGKGIQVHDVSAAHGAGA